MFHIQSPVNNWLDAVRKLPPKALVKAISVQQLSDSKAANQGVVTLHRYVNDDLQVVDWSDTDETRVTRAREWFDRFIDDTFLNQETAGIPHWQATNMISWWNEYYATGDSKTELWWRQERIAAQVWRDEYRNGPNKAKLQHIRLTIAAAPVGNDIPFQTAQTAVDYDCVVDYHAYSHYTGLNTPDPFDWQYHSGRWVTMYNSWLGRGLAPDILHGEAGPYEAAETGWGSNACLGGNATAYVDRMRWFIHQIAGTYAYQNGKHLGFALFTTGGGSRWKYFETKQPELNALADMIRVEWKPGNVPPQPNSGLNEALINRSLELQCISLNNSAALQAKITRDGRQPVGSEGRMTYNGKQYALQPAESLTQQGRWVYWCVVGEWNNIKVIVG